MLSLSLAAVVKCQQFVSAAASLAAESCSFYTDSYKFLILEIWVFRISIFAPKFLPKWCIFSPNLVLSCLPVMSACPIHSTMFNISSAAETHLGRSWNFCIHHEVLQKVLMKVKKVSDWSERAVS